MKSTFTKHNILIYMNYQSRVFIIFNHLIQSDFLLSIVGFISSDYQAPVDIIS